jgi:large subunit ribosomal protein L22
MKTQATAKFVGTSARKIGLVAALLRGRRVADAQAILANTNKRAVGPVGKVLTSAVANAENNFNAKAAELVVESVLVGPGPSLKRNRARGKGSAAPILKRSSHITVVVTDGKAAAKLSSKPALKAAEVETEVEAEKPETKVTKAAKAAAKKEAE